AAVGPVEGEVVQRLEYLQDAQEVAAGVALVQAEEQAEDLEGGGDLEPDQGQEQAGAPGEGGGGARAAGAAAPAAVAGGGGGRGGWRRRRRGGAGRPAGSRRRGRRSRRGSGR